MGADRVLRGVLATGAWLAALTAAQAQEPVKALQDLVGAKGGQAEMALTKRGYTWVGNGPAPRELWGYWREAKTNECVGVRIGDGRYRAIVYAAEAECTAAAANQPTAPPPSRTGFATVCGVTANGKEYRYKCTVEGVAAGQPGETVLHFPDNQITFKWLGGDRVSVTFSGMNPMDATFTTSDGVTRFTFEEKPYFFVSDRTAAAAQLKELH